MRRNGVRIYATPVPHYDTVGPVALRLEWEGLSVVYSGECGDGGRGERASLRQGGDEGGRA